MNNCVVNKYSYVRNNKFILQIKILRTVRNSDQIRNIKYEIKTETEKLKPKRIVGKKIREKLDMVRNRTINLYLKPK